MGAPFIWPCATSNKKLSKFLYCLEISENRTKQDQKWSWETKNWRQFYQSPSYVTECLLLQILLHNWTNVLKKCVNINCVNWTVKLAKWKNCCQETIVEEAKQCQKAQVNQGAQRLDHRAIEQNRLDWRIKVQIGGSVFPILADLQMVWHTSKLVLIQFTSLWFLKDVGFGKWREQYNTSFLQLKMNFLYFIHLSLSLSLCLFSSSRCPSIHLSICLSLYLSLLFFTLSLSLSLSLSIYIYIVSFSVFSYFH